MRRMDEIYNRYININQTSKKKKKIITITITFIRHLLRYKFTLKKVIQLKS